MHHVKIGVRFVLAMHSIQFTPGKGAQLLHMCMRILVESHHITLAWQMSSQRMKQHTSAGSRHMKKGFGSGYGSLNPGHRLHNAVTPSTGVFRAMISHHSKDVMT